MAITQDAVEVDRSSTDDWSADVDLIDADTLSELEAEPGEGCRFGAVAKTQEYIGAQYHQIRLPITIVLYVDNSGQYGFERTFFGSLEWEDDIPRSVPVQDTEAVTELPSHRQDAVKPLLEIHEQV